MSVGSNHEKQTLLPFKPPFLMVGLVVLGFIIEYLSPLPLLGNAIVRFALGLTLLSAGGALMGASKKAFKAHGEEFSHGFATSALVSEGPFARSRNPIYVAGTLLMCSVGVLANTLWVPLTVLLLGVPLLHFLVVKPEEAYLRATLGEEYLEYSSKVRRWF
jgi:protein-S-isoprenylcysteine O-methyltransferase Ste14